MRVQLAILTECTVHFGAKADGLTSIQFFIELPFKPKRKETIAIGQFIDYIQVDLADEKKWYIQSDLAVIEVISHGMWMIDEAGVYYSVTCKASSSYIRALEKIEELEREQHHNI